MALSLSIRFKSSGSATPSLMLWVMLVVAAAALAEGSAFLGLYLLGRYSNVEYAPLNDLSEKHADILKRLVNEEPAYQQIDSTLGWSIKENGRTELYQANTAGIRGSREYAARRAADILRILAFGDSFTHGDDVRNADTWASVMEDRSDTFEVLNFGVGGYGLDQSYLRYLENRGQYDSQIVLIGFMSENIFRNVNRYRPFYYQNTGVPLGKPRFQIDEDGLRLLANPFVDTTQYQLLQANPETVLPRAGQNDYYYPRGYESGFFDWLAVVRLSKIVVARTRDRFTAGRIEVNDRYNVSSEAFRVTTRLFDMFHAEVLSDDALPVIVVFPNEYDLIQYRQSGTTRYSPLIAHFVSESYEYIDLIHAFENLDTSHDIGDFFEHGHYTPLGNRLVAEHLLDHPRMMPPAAIKHSETLHP